MIVPEYPPDTIGGGGVVFEALANAYVARGHRVRVFSSWDPERSWTAGPKHEQKGLVTVTRCPLIPLGRKSPALRSVPPPNLRVWRYLRRELPLWRPDVGHVHGYGHAITDIGGRLLTRIPVPYVFTVHGLPVTPLQQSAPLRFAYEAYEWIGPRHLVRRACAVTAVSSAVACRLDEYDRVNVIPNGVSRLSQGAPSCVSRLRSELSIPRGVPVIAAAGRLARSKGFDVLIKAFARLTVPQAACVIAGADGGELANLTALGTSLRSGLVVRLPGTLDRATLGDLMKVATVVAVPSRDEPFGLVALEALAAGRRVVASKVGGLVDVLRDPVAELVDVDDPGVLTEALERALKRGPLSFSEQNIADRILSLHSWSKIACRYEALLHSCVIRASSDTGSDEVSRVVT